MRRDPLGSRLRAVAVGMVPPFGDVGAVSIICEPHPYLLCGRGHRLSYGQTFDEAGVYVCPTCETILDMRRVA